MIDDRALVDPTRAGSLDVVVLHRPDHVDPDEADEDARRDEPERDRRKDQVLRDVDELVPIAVDQGVDRVDVRVRLDRGVHEWARTVGRRQPPEVRAEEELGHEPEEEHRRRVDDDPEEPAAAVDPRVPEAPGEETERHADDDRDDHRVEGQLERCHAVVEDDVGDLPAVRRRDAEVASRDVAQVVDVLLEDRAVVPELLPDPVDLLLRDTAAQRR